MYSKCQCPPGSRRFGHCEQPERDEWLAVQSSNSENLCWKPRLTDDCAGLARELQCGLPVRRRVLASLYAGAIANAVLQWLELARALPQSLRGIQVLSLRTGRAAGAQLNG